MDDFIVFFFSSTPLESFAKSTRCFPFRFDFNSLTPVVYAKHQRNTRTSSNGTEKNNFRQIQTRRVFPRKYMPSALMAIRSRFAVLQGLRERSTFTRKFRGRNARKLNLLSQRTRSESSFLTLRVRSFLCYVLSRHGTYGCNNSRLKENIVGMSSYMYSLDINKCYKLYSMKDGNNITMCSISFFFKFCLSAFNSSMILTELSRF